MSEGKHVVPGNYFNTANMLTKDNIQVPLLACYFCTYKDNRTFLAVKDRDRGAQTLHISLHINVVSAQDEFKHKSIQSASQETVRVQHWRYVSLVD